MAVSGLAALAAMIVLPGARPASAAAGPPHVMMVLMENTSYEGIVGNAQMPFVNALVNTYGSASTTDLSHPSLPNYLGYVSGSIQNNPQDTTPQDGTYAGPQLTDELASAGIGWKAYMQDMPAACDLTDQYSPGSYDVNHNPFMYFNSVRNNPNQCNRDVPYSQLTTDLNAGTAPPFLWVTPNTINDMHDGTPAQGDAFLQGLVTQVQASSWWTAGSRIVITWDEGTQSEQVLTLVVGSAHGTSANGGNEYGTLRGLEEVYGVGLLGHSADSNVGDILPLLGGPSAGPALPITGRFLAGDFNGDGKADLALVGTAGISVGLSTASASSSPTSWAAFPFYGSVATLAGDVTGDGKADLVAVNAGQTFVLPSTGTAFGSPAAWSGVPFYGTRGTFLADVNGDGKADLVAINDSSVWVMLSTGTAFAPPAVWSGARFFGNLSTQIADVTGDGRADLVALNSTSTWVMQSTGTTFAAPAQWSSQPFYGTIWTQATDVTGDGRADMVALSGDSAWVMASTGSGFGPPSEWSSTAFYGQMATLWGDVSGDRKVDLIAINTSSIWVEQSTGVGFSAPAQWLSGPP